MQKPEHMPAKIIIDQILINYQLKPSNEEHQCKE